ncbi:transcription factor Sfl1 [Colletotrichum spaethianum]|uniref:Transcription factor Sfl1 n=1 Tax=Colletotrichum spaethianum TaxID=700344 RepID=A0AA37PFT5_9PEZI|nr:transcription factor Sfl1 [Colletotrichum spaethianum]GKT51424.1 transcription factor Sfl1 [Colletotrichum spaethianum]
MDERPTKKRRKRKIRCEFTSNEEQTCNGCQARGTICVSQEFIDDEPHGQPERGLAQRLGRLEELMVKLADKMAPDASTVNKANTPASLAEGSLGASESDSTPPELARPSKRVTVSSSVPGPAPTRPRQDRPRSGWKYEKVCQEVHAAFPSPQDANTIVHSSRGPVFVLFIFYSYQDILDGKSPPLASLTTMLDVAKHPALLAKHLLQLTICLQQLPPSFDSTQLELSQKGSIQDKMNEWVTVASLVTSNDELLGSVEGLQCLLLQGFYLLNCGNLRKAWLAMRRALSLAQLMGIEADGARLLKSCDPTTNPNTIPSSQALWSRINACDRWISLLLGLSAGTQDNSFMSEEFLAQDTPMERLEKKYTAVALRVIERNRVPTNEAYAITQSVDCELETAAKAMGRAWWEIPLLPDPTDTAAQMSTMSHLMLQIHHHSLLILLHLPYMLRNQTNSRFDYSKNTCLESSRAVLKRCVIFRTANDAAFSCRHIDYSSLMASMTLLLGHLSRPPNVREEDWSRQRNEDRALAETVMAKMEELALLNDDKLSGESAEIIRQLLPIVDCCNGMTSSPYPEAARNLKLSIPYLGVINIKTTANQAAEPHTLDLSHSQLPTPSNTTTVSSEAYQETPPAVALEVLLGEDNTIPHEDFCAGFSADYLGGGHALASLPKLVTGPSRALTLHTGLY